MPFGKQIFLDSIDSFISPPQRKYQFLSNLYLILLYLGGIFLWGFYFNWGRWSDSFHDWAEITAPRLTVLKNAITTGQIPFHTAIPAILGDITSNRFLAIPDIILSPQIILLRVLRVNQFSLFQIIFLFSLGFLGLVWIQRTQKLSLLTFTVIFFLYNFNGHILAHLSIGHLTWGGYFLFSWFAVLIFELLDGKGSWLWAAKVSLLLFFILLQGSYHQMIWLLLFIELLGIFLPRHFWLLLGTSVLTVFLSMVRLLPEVSLLGKLDNAFMTGYPDVFSLIQSMIQIVLPGEKGSINQLTANIGYWETTIYIGVIGLIFLVYFGFFRTLTDPEIEHSYRLVLLPVLGLYCLSFEKVFSTIQKVLPIPIFTGERVSTRLVSLAFVFLLFLAGIGFQKWLNTIKDNKLTLGIALLLGLPGIHDLYQNYSKWTILSTTQAFRNKLRFYDSAQWFIKNDYRDSFYLHLILIGFTISVVSLIFISIVLWKETRKTLDSQRNNLPLPINNLKTME